MPIEGESCSGRKRKSRTQGRDFRFGIWGFIEKDEVRSMRRIMEHLIFSSESPRNYYSLRQRTENDRRLSHRSGEEEEAYRNGRPESLVKENRDLQDKVKELKSFIVQINLKQSELENLRREAQVRVMQEQADSDETEERRDLVNDLLGPKRVKISQQTQVGSIHQKNGKILTSYN